MTIRVPHVSRQTEHGEPGAAPADPAAPVAAVAHVAGLPGAREAEPPAREAGPPGPGGTAAAPAPPDTAGDGPGRPAPGVPLARPSLPRVALLARHAADEHGRPMTAARELAAGGRYVLLAVPAETGTVTTTVTSVADGLVRVLRVPADPEAAAEVTAAGHAAALVHGTGVGAGLRRRAAQQRLRRARRRARRSAERAGAAWGQRCAEAFRPYVEAFAPRLQAAADRAPRFEPPAPRRAAGGRISLAIGPCNTEGQGRAWARAVTAHLPGVRAEALGLVSRHAHGGPADVAVTTDEWLSPRWQLSRLAHVLDTFTHVVAEGALPAFGRLNGPWAGDDLTELRAAGVAVALALHGPDARDPARHRARVPHSPFDPGHPLTRILQARADALASVVRDLDVPVFVSSPDLLADFPGAVWLPVVVDPAVWETGSEILRGDRPVVLHGGNSPFLSGTSAVEPVLRDLHDAGVVEYRTLRGVPPHRVPEALAAADIVLDDVAIGTYGPLAVRAMAAGRLTMSYLDPSVAGHLPGDVPVAAIDPREIADAILCAIEEPRAARELAARGPAYVRAHHDGRRSARALAGFLGLSPGTAGQRRERT